MEMLDAKAWVTVAFCVFFLIFGRKLYRVLVGALDARSAKIAHDLAEAARLRKEAEESLIAYKKREQECYAQAQEIVEKAKQDAASMAAAAQAELQRTIAARTESAMKKIEQEEIRALQEVQHQVIDFSIAVAHSLLGDRLNESAGQDAAVTQALTQLERGKLH